MEHEADMETRTPLGPLTASQRNAETRALDFSKLTPSQFGISPSSFTAFPKDKDKSRVAQLKARRRSTIGVRGSPETNSLICFRAKQAMKTPPRTPQHLLESPLFSGRDSIKQKMEAFQRLMGTDEENTEHFDSPMKEGKAEERARHTLSDIDGGSEERENRLAPVTPPLSKRRRKGTPHRGLWEDKVEEEPLSELSHVPTSETQVEFKSPKMVPSLGLGLDSQSQLMSLPMLSNPELIKTGDVQVSSVSKKKRVRFGAPLSPEFFDKTLPPSTPLQKGATPARPPSSTGHKHSLLKTPQRFEPPLTQPDFSSPGGNGASPVLSTHTYCDREVDNDDVFLDNQKISFPIMDEEYNNPPVESKDLAEISEFTKEITDAAVQNDTAPSPDRPPHPPAAELRAKEDDQHQHPKTPESFTEAPRSRGRKRKQPAESETTETRRSSRSAAKSAKGKIKTSSAKKRFGTKEVDRSLYGKRDYASKNPLLSPIIETAMSSLSSTPTQPRTGETPGPSPATAPSTNQSKTALCDGTADLVAAAALWRRRFIHQDKNHDSESNSVLTDAHVQSEVSVEYLFMSVDKRVSAGKAGRGRRNSASRHRSWSSVNAKDEHEVGDQETENHQSESCKSNKEENPAGEQSISERKSERKAPTGGRPRGQKSASTKYSAVAEEEEQSEEQRGLEKTCQDMVESSGSEKEEVKKKDEDMRQTSGHEVEEKNDEDSSPSSVPLETLEDWQQPDFCIEDVLKPVAKSRGSVRRSLRHRKSMDILDKGLAWVEHTSPQMTTHQRRRTRGRLSAVSQPPPFPDSKETPTNL